MFINILLENFIKKKCGVKHFKLKFEISLQVRSYFENCFRLLNKAPRWDDAVKKKVNVFINLIESPFYGGISLKSEQSVLHLNSHPS